MWGGFVSLLGLIFFGVLCGWCLVSWGISWCGWCAFLFVVCYHVLGVVLS